MTDAQFTLSFICPKHKVSVASKLPPMSRSEFDHWQRQDQRRVADCAACGDAHILDRCDYSLGDTGL
jgi:hypothetical protein